MSKELDKIRKSLSFIDEMIVDDMQQEYNDEKEEILNNINALMSKQSLTPSKEVEEARKLALKSYIQLGIDFQKGIDMDITDFKDFTNIQKYLNIKSHIPSMSEELITLVRSLIELNKNKYLHKEFWDIIEMLDVVSKGLINNIPSKPNLDDENKFIPRLTTRNVTMAEKARLEIIANKVDDTTSKWLMDFIERKQLIKPNLDALRGEIEQKIVEMFNGKVNVYFNNHGDSISIEDKHSSWNKKISISKNKYIHWDGVVLSIGIQKPIIKYFELLDK